MPIATTIEAIGKGLTTQSEDPRLGNKLQILVGEVTDMCGFRWLSHVSSDSHKQKHRDYEENTGTLDRIENLSGQIGKNMSPFNVLGSR